MYQVVEKAGNKGIWHKDIRSQTSLQQPVRAFLSVYCLSLSIPINIRSSSLPLTARSSHTHLHTPST